jgi:hypothetical protein
LDGTGDLATGCINVNLADVVEGSMWLIAVARAQLHKESIADHNKASCRILESMSMQKVVEFVWAVLILKLGENNFSGSPWRVK